MFRNIAPHTTIIVGVSTAALFGLAFILRRRALKNALTVPTNWQEVGKLTHLMCFPIKSCGVVHLTECFCTNLGLVDGFLRDRIMMVVDHEGKFITARSHGKMTQIRPEFDATTLNLSAKGMPTISIDLKLVKDKPCSKTMVWGQEVVTVDCGDHVAAWLTTFLLEGREPGVRLVYYTKTAPTRAVRPKNKIFVKCTDNDVGALADATSFNMLSQSSVDDLNTRLKKPVSVVNFRPNFVVKGSQPYEEDEWNWVRIGSTVFRNVKPCTRCLLTTVDPNTGVKDPKQEPLRTLKTYRQIMDPALRPSVGDSPVLGIHLTVHEPGVVKIGDSIYVA